MKTTPEKKVTGDECARLEGVGQSTVIAAKKMLGISGCRRIYCSHIHTFLYRYPDFQCADARDDQSRTAFADRHPEFKVPNAEVRHSAGKTESVQKQKEL